MGIWINKGNVAASRRLQRLRYHLRRGKGNLLRYLLNRWRWTRLPRRSIVSRFPEHVDLELSSVCDLACPMCYTVTARFKREVPHRLMDADLFRHLVDECAREGAYSIRLSLRGEAFLHPEIVSLVRYAKGRGIPEVSTLTNNHKLDEATFIELMDAGLDWLTISFDGTGERYDSIRAPNTFDSSLEKIKAYQRLKRERRAVKPVIKVQSVWPAIAEDPQVFFDVFEGLVDEIAVNPIIDYTHLQSESAIVYEDDFTCPSLWQRLVVFSDGRVPLCQNDEFGSTIIGDARETSLREIWQSPAMQRQREVQRAGCGVRENRVCAECYLPRKTRPLSVELRDRTLRLFEYEVTDPSERRKLVRNLDEGSKRRPSAKSRQAHEVG